MDKIIAITGASAGIGRATAIRLAGQGASIVLCARRREPLERTAADVERAGGRALPIVGDVTRPEDMQALVAAAIDHFGRLDVMMCNAGFGIYGPIDTIDPSQMRRLLDVNYFGTYHAIRAALPHFRARNAGHFFVVSSIVGRRGVPGMGAYSATKFAQVGLAECLRAELVGSGIHLSVVFPISTETDFQAVMVRESGFATRASGPRQPADAVAASIARAIDRPAAEIYPYRTARGLALLSVIAPAFCDRLAKKWGRTPVATTGAPAAPAGTVG
jgi:NADP-dependent 3-hydroxy acid dehydrogenase YdfG